MTIPAPATARDPMDAAGDAIRGQFEALIAQRDALVAALQWAYDTLQEINPSNYDHDDVCALNAASVEVILGIKSALSLALGEQ